MPADPHDPRTQEQSIKARKHQLFEDEEIVSSGPSLPFPELLRVTPSEPLAPPVKALLWVVGTIVILLLVAALLTSGGGRKAPKKTGARRGSAAVGQLSSSPSPNTIVRA